MDLSPPASEDNWSHPPLSLMMMPEVVRLTLPVEETTSVPAPAYQSIINLSGVGRLDPAGTDKESGREKEKIHEK